MQFTRVFSLIIGIGVFGVGFFVSLPVLAQGIHELDDAAHTGEFVDTGMLTQDVGGEVVVTSRPEVSKPVIGFHPYWNSDVSGNRYDLMTHVAYFGLNLNADGSLGAAQGWPSSSLTTNLVATAHSKGVKVLPVFKNFSKSDLGTLLGSAENRSRGVGTIVAQVKAGNADGALLDFENVPGDKKSELTIFVKQLGEELKTAVPGAHVSVTVPAVDWSDAFDARGIASYADSVVLMGYDYHYKGSSEAGPVAPLREGGKWNGLSVRKSVDAYANEMGGLKSKLILGVPYYGYDWPVSSDGVPSTTTGSAFARTYSNIVENFSSSQFQWDADALVPFIQYSDDGQRRQVWFDNGASLARKFDLVNDTEIGGIAIWALGYDAGRDEFWDLISSKFGDPTIASFSQRIVTAPGPGGGPHVKAFSVGGTFDVFTNFLAYDGGFRGGVNLATGDIDGDGVDEIVTGAGPGGGPHVRTFEMDGTAKAFQFFPFDRGFRGGIDVAAGDVDGDGRDEVGMCQEGDGQAWVKVYRTDGSRTILAYANVFGSPEVGCHLAFGDVDRDGKDELIVGAGQGGGPHVLVFEVGARSVSGPGQGLTRKPISLFAFSEQNRSGIDVSAGDVDGDGKDEIFASQLRGDEAWVKAYRYESQKRVLGNFRAYGQGVYSGARIDAGDVDGDGKAEIVVGPDANGGPHVRLFEASGASAGSGFFAYGESFRGGVRAAVAND